MADSFLSNGDETAKVQLNVSASKPGREPIRFLAIGSPRGVISKIHTLYHLGFAEVGDWSPLLPSPNPGEVMSILTQYISEG